MYRSTSLVRPSLAFAALAALALSLAYFAAPGIVRADGGSIQWGGNGSDLLPCDGGAHWVLSPADGIDSATLHVGNATYVMTQNGQGSWAADSAGAVPSDQSQVWVEFTGPGDNKDHLQLSHCLTGEDQGASLLIRKTSSVFVDGKAEHLAGAVFSVEIDGTVIGTFTTDSDGAICLTGLPHTVQATITEITPPPGYDLPTVTSQTVWVDDNDICQSAEAIFRDPPKTASQSASASASASTSASASASQSASASASGSPEGSVGGATGSPEGSVEAATGSPAASTPNTAFGVQDAGSAPTLLGLIALGLGLSLLAFANVRSSRRRR